LGRGRIIGAGLLQLPRFGQDSFLAAFSKKGEYMTIPKSHKKKQLVPAYPEPYIRKKRKRGRPLKNGRPKEDIYDQIRSSPSKRSGSRFKTVSTPEDVFFMLTELAMFYKMTKSAYLVSLIKPAFEKAYQESLTLQRIAANKQKAKDETPERTDPPRRTHF
jgi:hypothetical protein